MKLIDIPPVWLFLFACLAWGQARLLPVGSFGGWADWAGAALVVIGIGLMIAAVFEMTRARTTVIPHQAPSAIVTSGIFGISRNPIYLGDAMVLAGLVLRWDAIPSVLLVPAFIMVIERRFIRDEENRLRAAFPDEFAAWSSRVRRWL